MIEILFNEYIDGGFDMWIDKLNALSHHQAVDFVEVLEKILDQMNMKISNVYRAEKFVRKNPRKAQQLQDDIKENRYNMERLASILKDLPFVV